MTDVDKRLTDWNNVQTTFEILTLSTLDMYKYTHTDIDATVLARGVSAASMLQVVSLGNDNIKAKVEKTISDNEDVAEFMTIVHERFNKMLGEKALASVDLKSLTPIELFSELCSSRLYDRLRGWGN